jgi:LacI family transcriptional regulator
MAKKGRVSYKDIGKAVGLSPMTVSLALRNHSSIPEHTKERIRKAAEALGYRPDPRINQMMQYMSWRRGRQEFPIICFLNAWKDRHAWKKSPYVSRLHKAAKRRADALGYQLEDFWLMEPHMTPRRFKHILETRSIRGILVPPLPWGSDEVNLELNDFSVVTTSYSTDYLGCHLVTVNRHQVIQLALRKIAEKGFHRVGLVLDENLDRRSNHDVLAHYLLQQKNLPRRQQVNYLLRRELNPEVIWDWFRKEKPEVVVSMNNEVYDWLLSKGLNIPADVAFVSLSNSRKNKEGYTGVDERSDIIGSVAIDVITAHLQRNEVGLPLHRKLTLLEGEWIEGKTLPVDRVTFP